jgi:hypothetical protein
VIVLEIDIEDVARGAVFEAEGQPPIAADRDCIGSAPRAVKLMKSMRSDQISDAGSAVDRVEPQVHALVKLRPDAARAPGKEDLFHAFVREGPNRHGNFLLIELATIDFSVLQDFP